MNADGRPADADPPDVVRRPPGQLHDLPVEARWEVTRRHPYYQALWAEARRYRQDPPGDPADRRLFGYAATLVLGAVGVTGEPVDPATPFDGLAGPGTDPAFLSGAVQPMTLRNVTAMLLAALPPAARAFVGALLLTSGSEEYRPPGGPAAAGRPSGPAAELDQVARTPCPALDACPDAPLFYVHLGAFQRSIVRDAEDQVRRWKARRGDASSKVHAAKIGTYLAAWDLREGWAGGGYDRGRELPFAAVARRLRRPPSTIFSQYKAAFEFVTGHPFAPGLWWRLFGPLKFGLPGRDAGAGYSATTRHRLRPPAPRPVPDSVVSPATGAAHASGTVERGSAVADDVAYTDLLIDLRDLIARGLPDGEIARRLDLPDPGLVADARARIDELHQLSR